jgi:RNA polymerase sigma-70 factor (ECF subfamily)
MNSDDETSWAALRQLLVARYDEFQRRLTRRLGSADVARETLHELYLRLDRPDSAGTLQNPRSYLLTSALNLARDHWRAEQRRGERIDIDALYAVVDENPGPERIVDSRRAVELLNRAFLTLTPRQRKILLAVRLEGLTQPEIASRLHISERYVRTELQRALEQCHRYLAKNL